MAEMRVPRIAYHSRLLVNEIYAHARPSIAASNHSSQVKVTKLKTCIYYPMNFAHRMSSENLIDCP